MRLSNRPFLKRSAPIRLLASAVLALCLAGCSLFEDEPLPFAWMQPGTHFVYDFHSATTEPFVDVRGNAYTDVDSAYVLRIVKPDYNAPLRFLLDLPTWSAAEFRGYTGRAIPILSPLFQISPAPRRTPEGIEAGYPDACSGKPFDLSVGEASSVVVPAKAKVGERYVYYQCGNRVDTTYDVEAAGLSVEVPAGRFEEVFALRSSGDFGGYYEVQYWSEPEGLIQVEKFYPDGRLLGTYRLTSKNF